MKETMKFIISILLVTINITAFSQQIFIRELTYEISSNERYATARASAINEIKRALSDELGSYIVSQSSLEINNSNDNFYQSFANNTQSVSLSYMKVKIIDENKKAKSLYIKASIEVDDNKLQQELSINQDSNKGKLLNKVFELLQKNNVGSTSIIVLKNTNDLLSDISLFEAVDNSKIINNVSKDPKGKIQNGNEALNGKFKITYRNKFHTLVSIKDGYMNGLFQTYDATNYLLSTGLMEDNLQKGIWKFYKPQSHNLAMTIDFNKGKRNGKTTSFDKYDSTKINEIVYFLDGVPQKQEFIDNDGGVYFGNLNQYGEKDGVWIGKEVDGKETCKINYHNGLKNGDFIRHYKNGNIESKGVYKNDTLIEKLIDYYENGNLLSETNYDSFGKMIGLKKYYENGQLASLNESSKQSINTIHYYENGKLKKEEHYNKNWKNHGVYKEFYENGNLKEQAFYENGLLTGKHLKNLEDGKPSRIENFIIINGESKKHGPCISYYSDGKRREDAYINGDIAMMKEYASSGKLNHEVNYPGNGEPKSEKYYFENGQLKEERYYMAVKKGTSYNFSSILVGKHRKFTKDGVLIYECNYKDGKLDGRYIENFDSGHPKIIKNYKDDILNGSYEKYYKPGEPNVITNYKDGKLDGVCKTYSSNNAIVEQSNYKQGVNDGLCITYINPNKKREDTYKNGRIVHMKLISGEIVIQENDYPFNGQPSTEKIFFKNGKLKEIKHYKAPEQENAKKYTRIKVGEYKLYDLTGKLIKDEVWLDGKKQ